MKETRSVEVKYINVISVFKFFGGIFLLIGLVIGLFGRYFMINIMSNDIIGVFPFMTMCGPGILVGIIFGVINGLCAAIGFSIFALLYNFFAALFGGIKLYIQE